MNLETYGNTKGSTIGKLLVNYFPVRSHSRVKDVCVHCDPEFQTFTYGDPTTPKAGLRKLKKGDLLVFYAGLAGWDRHCDPALYIIGYFEVEKAILARNYDWDDLQPEFGGNFHLRHRPVFDHQKDRLVLIKGRSGSRFLKTAKRISVQAKNKAGRPIHVLSPEMRRVFGDFGGHIIIHRSPPRLAVVHH